MNAVQQRQLNDESMRQRTGGSKGDKAHKRALSMTSIRFTAKAARKASMDCKTTIMMTATIR